ncbi:COG4223 family protein [Hyphomicrobium sulfonivorans]|uniref:COG4223 family protein n=1 Tax=Hyphomicrobium sulfonivorans TaxID=121290 RepID=UPI00157047CB|nr:hypothetical protein [Hyphomicrobium sulfonivorans]MBI1648369.1 hypothetical protein [Hyphomicrobium sulfonivorans]NSL71095.1 hypothetical protein [Hyphomicrobium sulfonivorans]
MTANKNGPGKQPAGSASQQGNRPHATLDLKAQDVTPPETAKDKDAPKDAAAAAASAKPGETAATGKTEASAAAASAATSASGTAAKTDATSADKAAKGGDTPKASATATGAKEAPAQRTRRGGIGSFISHIAAGVAGGAIALFAGDQIANHLGVDLNRQQSQALSALEQRLGAVETSQAQNAVNPELATRIAAAEAKLGQVEQLNANIEGVTRKQADLSTAVGNISDKVLTQGSDSDAGKRIAKLEDQLALMSTAAANDPNAGQLPQLAALTGKLADLEATLGNQLDALRKNLTQQIDTRLTAAAEVAEAARSGTQRIDRELSTIKAENAEIVTGVSSLKSEDDRVAAAIRSTQEEIKRLKTEIDTRLTDFAKSDEVSTAVNPITSRLAALHKDVQTVLQSEGARKSTAERIVLSLELANLKRAIYSGNSFAPELEETSKIAGNIVDLSPLKPFALDGVDTTAELRDAFKPVAYKIIDAEDHNAEASIVDRLLAGAKSVVRVRRTDHAPEDKSIEAVVARMEAALEEDRLADVLKEAKTLPAPAQDAAADFLKKVEARNTVEHALASVETQLKSSLAAAPAPADDNTAQ